MAAVGPERRLERSARARDRFAKLSYEALAFWHGTMSGTASGDFSHLVVFELDAKCKPRQIGFTEGGLFASRRAGA